MNKRKEGGFLARDSRIYTAQFTVLTNDWCMAKKKARFFHLFRHEVFMKDIKHRYKSFILLFRTSAGQFAVNCGYHVYRYCYIHSMETLQTYER